jgi:hypothetical protein
MMGLPVWTWPDWRTARPGTRSLDRQEDND